MLRCGTRTLIIFTGGLRCSPRLVFYIHATVDLRSAGTTRRWRPTIAIVATLSIFVALIAGSSLRPQLAAAELPEPVAWTHGTQSAQAQGNRGQLHVVAAVIGPAARSVSPGSAPTDKKPFHSMWMTRDRPAGWTHVAPHSVWLALPASFAGPEFQPDCADRAASTAPSANRDLLTQLCVDRC